MLMNTGSIIRCDSWEPARQGSLPQFNTAISIARQLVSLASTLPSMSSLSQELTSPERLIPRPTLMTTALAIGFQRIGQIGEAAHRLAGARRNRLWSDRADGFLHKIAIVGCICHFEDPPSRYICRRIRVGYSIRLFRRISQAKQLHHRAICGNGSNPCTIKAESVIGIARSTHGRRRYRRIVVTVDLGGGGSGTAADLSRRVRRRRVHQRGTDMWK